jgi:hypothetical protein
MEPTELRERLHRLADRSAPPIRDTDDLVRTVADRLHDRRRKERALAAVGAVLAVVLVAVPIALSRTADDPGPAAPAHSSGVYTTPTRGGLSDDLDFVEGVRRLPWTNGPAGSDGLEAPLDSRRVVYASDVPGARWALVAGASPTALPPDEGVDPADLGERTSMVIAWFTGPSGATVEEMSLYSVPRVVRPDRPTALADTVTGVAVIVAAPGDRIEVSRTASIDTDGTPTREYTSEDAPQGIAVVSETPVAASIDRALKYRVITGSAVFSDRADAYPNPDFTPPDVELARLRPAPSPAPGDATVVVAIDEELSRSGLVPPAVSFTELWAGDVPTTDGGSGRLTLLAAEFSGGGVHVVAGLGWDGGGGPMTRACGSEARPAGTPLDDQVFVVRCDPENGVPTNSLVVVAPPGTASARALDAGGGPLADYPLVDGVAVVPVPANLATVEVLDAHGETVYDDPPMGHAPLGD